MSLFSYLQCKQFLPFVTRPLKTYKTASHYWKYDSFMHDILGLSTSEKHSLVMCWLIDLSTIQPEDIAHTPWSVAAAWKVDASISNFCHIGWPQTKHKCKKTKTTITYLCQFEMCIQVSIFNILPYLDSSPNSYMWCGFTYPSLHVYCTICSRWSMYAQDYICQHAWCSK